MTVIPCPYCDFYDKSQHSIKRHGICDGIRKGLLRHVKGAVTVLKTGRRVATITPTMTRMGK